MTWDWQAADKARNVRTLTWIVLTALGVASPAWAILPGTGPRHLLGGQPYYLNLTFTNRSGFPDDEVFVWFDNPITALFDGNSNVVQPYRSYSLATIGSGGLDVSAFVSGRIYVSYGAPFPAQTSNAVPPQFNESNPPAVNNSYNNLHQLVTEITLTPSSTDKANLSNIDWVSFPAALRTYSSNGTQLQRVGFPDNVNFGAYITALSGLTGGDALVQSVVNTTGNVPTSYSQTGTPTTASQFPMVGGDVRLLSPTSNLILSQAGLNTYPSFSSYVSQIQTDIPSGTIATLQGTFFVSGTPTYNFTVNSITSPGGGDPSWSLGQVTMTGTISTDPVGTTHTIVIPYESFSDVTIYGGTTGSPSNQGVAPEKGIGYYLDGNLVDGGSNTIFTLPVRDFLAGLNYGYIDSSVINPNDPNGNTYGVSASQYWGATNLLTNLPQIFQGFEQVQPNNSYYNQWASIVHQYSNGQVYGFAYDDTFSPVQIDVVKHNGTQVSRLDVLLLPFAEPDRPGPQQPASVPEASTLGLVAVAAVAAWMLRRRVRRPLH